MNRKQVYQAINSERDYQDMRWGGRSHDEKESLGNWIIYMEDYLAKARQAFTDGREFDTRAEIRKVTALGVACMEQQNVESRDVVNAVFKVYNSKYTTLEGFPGLGGTQFDIYLDSPLLRPGYIIAPIIAKRHGVMIHSGPTAYGDVYAYGVYLVDLNLDSYMPVEYLQKDIEYMLVGIKDTPWDSYIKGSEIKQREEFLAKLKSNE